VATNVNKGILVTTLENKGTVRYGDIYPGRVAVVKGSAFVNSRVVEIGSRLVRDSSDRRRSEGVQCVSCYNKL
jgi:hypothetical protein